MAWINPTESDLDRTIEGPTAMYHVVVLLSPAESPKIRASWLRFSSSEAQE